MSAADARLNPEPCASSFYLSYASILDLDHLAPLFNAYRQFYGCPDNVPEARAFLAERLATGDSKIYLARNSAGETLAFAQVFACFSSIALCRSWVLNDLYVQPAYRGQHVGEALLAQVEKEAQAAGIGMLMMETGPENVRAHRIYQKMGYAREMGYLHFVRRLKQ
ncbi:GNAT family N-acetyltransferase [uncultured Deefgea sp.]|uniref:GNAT family N-acetyltransferase n=1 Tax=uncultured Deefgea sp. TaxID=1304914 RepID=UPI0026392A37|nr:GNAT family N-acetyltransferase [uncultured Deefgea sp.]